MTPLERAVEALRTRFGQAPSTAIVLGSGLGILVDQAQDVTSVPYGELNLPGPTVEGHAGTVVVGRLGSARVALLSGRIHVYEGRPMDEVVLAVRAMAVWGVERVVLTNAAGAVDPRFRPGDVMLMDDHLNLMGVNPLVGPPSPLGPRFPDMTTAYDPKLREDAVATAARLGFQLHRGVYAAMLGPSYETPAEIRMLSVMGANAVGMSTVPEVIALNHMGTPALAFSLISNAAASLGNAPLDHAEVTEAAGLAGGRLGALLADLVDSWT
jgi:purine-nucleoside phosphorylase